MPELRFFMISLWAAANILLFAACSKKSKTSINHNVKTAEQLNSGNEQAIAPIITLSSTQSNDSKRFSYSDFTRKTVQLSPDLTFPIPIGFSLVSTCHHHQADKLHVEGSCFVYESNLSIGKTILFYGKHLKEMGWSYENFSTIFEGLLLCTQKDLRVIISVRKIKQESEKTTQLILFFKHNHHQSKT